MKSKKKEIGILKDQVLQLQTIVRTLTGKIANMATATPNVSLQQNEPNPFNKSAIIHYSIPQDSKGQINIYNQTGKLVKALNTNDTGQSELNGNALAAGMYTYILTINGKVIGSKQTVVAK